MSYFASKRFLSNQIELSSSLAILLISHWIRGYSFWRQPTSYIFSLRFPLPPPPDAKLALSFTIMIPCELKHPYYSPFLWFDKSRSTPSIPALIYHNAVREMSLLRLWGLDVDHRKSETCMWYIYRNFTLRLRLGKNS